MKLIPPTLDFDVIGPGGKGLIMAHRFLIRDGCALFLVDVLSPPDPNWTGEKENEPRNHRESLVIAYAPGNWYSVSQRETPL